MNFLALMTLPQKIVAGGAAIALLGSIIFNIVQRIEIADLRGNVKTLSARIDDPKTGYVVRLAQATTNVETCKAAIQQQNESIKAQAEASAATNARVREQYEADHRLRVRAESSAAAILAHKPAGQTVADRVADVDAQILGDLK